jgi:hypothetical protein
MIVRAVALLSFGFAASAEARESAALRIGSHDGFVRVVIESPSRRSFTGSTAPGGRQGVIETSAELSVTRPGRPAAPISAITDTVRDPEGTRITLTFTGPMSLVHAMTLPSLGEKAYRHVFDFAPTEDGATAIQRDASVPSPPRAASSQPPETAPSPERPSQSLVAILQTAQLGLSDPGIREAIAAEFGSTQPVIRMSFKSPEGETGFLLTHRVQFDDIGPVQVIYKFSSRSERLNEVDLDWGAAGEAQLSDEDSHRIVTSLYRELRASGFTVVGPKGDTDTSDDATILLADGKAADRRATLSWMPLARRASQPSNPAVRLCLISRSGEQTGSARH